MTSTAWLDDIGLVTLPSGLRVRGRRQGDTVSPADFALLLADGPVPAWPHRHIHWPDFWIPINRADALDALREAHRRARAGERVEVTCGGGIGRIGPLPLWPSLTACHRSTPSPGSGPITTTARWKPRGNGYGFAQSTNQHPEQLPAGARHIRWTACPVFAKSAPREFDRRGIDPAPSAAHCRS